MSQEMLGYPEPRGTEFTSGHSGSDASRERALREARDGTAKDRQRQALRLLVSREFYGVTWSELAEVYNLHHGQASSVLSNLHKAKHIERLTHTRKRSHVYVLPQFVNGREIQPFNRNKTKIVTCEHCGRETRIWWGSTPTAEHPPPISGIVGTASRRATTAERLRPTMSVTIVRAIPRRSSAAWRTSVFAIERCAASSSCTGLSSRCCWRRSAPPHARGARNYY